MDHIGIEVHKKESQICILAGGGEVLEQRIRTGPEHFAAVLGARLRGRIVLETSTESEWLARWLEGLGHEVIVADPNFAPMYATRTRKVKTDRRDARALADACLLGAYRPAHRLSDPQRHVRARLLVRDAIVRTRTRNISLIRALLRQHGYRVPSGSAEGFLLRVRALVLPGPLRSQIAPLLAVMRHLNRQLTYSGETIEHIAVQDPRVQRLRSVPSIGPSPPRPSSPPSTTSTASGTPTRSKPTSASCPANTAPARASTAGTSPRPATPACAGS
jgi:transposase